MKKISIALALCFGLLTGITMAKATPPDMGVISTASSSTVVGFPGQTITAPIIADFSAATPEDTQFTLTYDPNLLTFASASLGTATTGWTIVSNVTTPGTLKVAMYNASTGTLSGTNQQMAVINFTVNATPGTATLTSQNLQLSGALLGNTAITTVVNANFTLGILGDVSGDGKVTSADALLVVQEVVGLTTFSPVQTVAAEVDGGTTVEVYDALLIAQYAQGLITKL